MCFLHSLLPHEKPPPKVWAFLKHCHSPMLLRLHPTFPQPCISPPGINYFMLLIGIISHIFYLKHWLTDCPQTALNPRTSCSCYVFTGYFSPLCTSNHLPVELKEKKTHTHKTNRWKMRDCTESRICRTLISQLCANSNITNPVGYLFIKKDTRRKPLFWLSGCVSSLHKNECMFSRD